MTDVIPFRPGCNIPAVTDDTEADTPRETWAAALEDCLGDGGLDGGVLIWRTADGQVIYDVVAWDALQVAGALGIVTVAAQKEAGG